MKEGMKRKKNDEENRERACNKTATKKRKQTRSKNPKEKILKGKERKRRRKT